MKTRFPALFALSLALAPPVAVQAQDVFTGDVVIGGEITQNGSSANYFNGFSTSFNGIMCVGSSCQSGESNGFGSPPLKLKYTTTDIIFEDTSTTAGIQSGDWRLKINDSGSGIDRFTIKDEDDNTMPFTVENAAPDNSLWVAGNGSIGLGTTLPQANLHIVDKGAFGEAGVRLEDTVGTSYIWDMRGNDAGFYLYDAIAGKLPFQGRPGAPSSSIEIVGDGKVGIGTGSPAAPLHLKRSNNTAAMLIEDTGAGPLGPLTLRNNGITFFPLEDSSIAAGDDTGRSWNFQNPAGTFRVTTAPGGAADVEMVLDPGGNMTLEGALHSIGDGAKLVAENHSGTTAARELMARKNNGIVYFSLEDTSRAAGPGIGRAWNFQNQSGEFRVTTEPGGPSDIEMRLTPAGNMHIKGQLFTGGSCAAGCDRVFDEDYPLPTIAEQAAMMREKKHLPNVGPTPEDGPFNITAMTGGMLNELEKAHLYIAQLEERDRQRADEVAALTARLVAIEAALTVR
ncbi:hypothetical protein ATO6_24495 [Oceanicola sp. 22II-s10i]|uniref:hypothetical protein n=1 Tax=Oceanicola sp. 22II-s10i TaxID=1317116 RepID=UPI000B51FB15|nr:hypothetical protein [Oceanicola sp. 22II-s10i]OWU80777.1 hypothetical protein ATO6_24495 [Oceanicola sp. 22II-s10i]